MYDLKLLAPITVNERSILGFSNNNAKRYCMFYKEGKVTYLSAQREFDSVQKLWNIFYKEQEWKDAPSGNPQFTFAADD